MLKARRRAAACQMLSAFPGLGSAALTSLSPEQREDCLGAIADEPLNDEQFERVLVQMRRALCAEWGISPKIPDAFADWLAVLGVLGFRHGFVLGAQAGEDQVAHPLATACYRPLTAPLDNPANSQWIALLNRVQYEQPLLEKQIGLTIPKFSDIADPTSLEVKAQYEESPYPMWWGRPSMPSAGKAGPILIAGCGTGREAISISMRSPEAKVTAIDITLASLSYGKRAADELGVANIEWLHGDILAVTRLQRKFATIVCTGVLHHMKNPFAGVRALREVLAPGGTMEIAIYSEPGRWVVKRAIKLRRELGLPSTPAGVHAFRQHVFDLPRDHPVRQLTTSDDFYSIPECRDLVFHVQELRFDLGGVKALIAASGLRFAGLKANPIVRQGFREMFGDDRTRDLEAWIAYERAHPGTFGSLYRVTLSESGEPARPI